MNYKNQVTNYDEFEDGKLYWVKEKDLDRNWEFLHTTDHRDTLPDAFKSERIWLIVSPINPNLLLLFIPFKETESEKETVSS
jgi:hypothetical protein